MDGLAGNPFTALSLIAAPAVLTNASSLLALGTSNRFARVVDRQRYLSKLLDADGATMDGPTGALWLRQLLRIERRARLVIRALATFYVSLGAFAAASLVSLIGASVSAVGDGTVAHVARLVALCTGVVGVGGLMIGCAILIAETRLTLAGLREESGFFSERFHARRMASPPADASPPPAR
ncbi:MAG: hypothetical protein JWN24_747 [Phycisphaerales bacterium]|nr:hypothetical protein [Phycisphaerales bacterium]